MLEFREEGKVAGEGRERVKEGVHVRTPRVSG